MKITHRVPIRELRSDPITPEYQAEVDRSTSKLEREYARAEKRLEAATRRAERAERALAARKVKPRSVEAAWVVVEARRAELAALAGLMRANPGAAAQHRSGSSVRPVPIASGRSL